MKIKRKKKEKIPFASWPLGVKGKLRGRKFMMSIWRKKWI
jgi:hypothetical protein